MSFLSTLTQAVGKLDGNPDPSVQKAADSGKQFLADFNAAIPALITGVVDSFLSEVPFGSAISGLLNPLIKGGVTLAEDTAEPWIEHALGFSTIVDTTPAPTVVTAIPVASVPVEVAPVSQP